MWILLGRLTAISQCTDFWEYNCTPDSCDLLAMVGTGPLRGQILPAEALLWEAELALNCTTERLW